MKFSIEPHSALEEGDKARLAITYWHLQTENMYFYEHYIWFFSRCTISQKSLQIFLGVLPSSTTDSSLSDPITQKTSQWKVVALCINKVLFMSYQSDNSLTDVNAICTVLWPKTASSSSPVIDKGAPSVTEHSTHFCYKKTVNYLMCRGSPGTADIFMETLWSK